VEAALENGAVDFAQLLFGLLIFDADDDAIGMKEVADGRALAKEFGVGSHAEARAVRVAPIDAEHAAQLLAGLRRDSAFLDDQLGRAGGRGDLARDIVDGGQIGVARVGGRRADADEDGVGRIDGIGAIRGEAQAAGGAGAFQDAVQARLVDGQAARVQGIDAVAIVIGGNDFVPGFGQAASGH
jgi:hypothetical protein